MCGGWFSAAGGDPSATGPRGGPGDHHSTQGTQ